MGRHERPLRPGPLHDFARDLRELRAGTGLTYRALSRTARYAPSALSDAASGDRLPTLQVLLAYVRACGGDTGAWAQRWHRLAADLRRTHPGLLSSGDQPGEAIPADGGADGPAEHSPEPEPAGFSPLASSDPREIGAFTLAARLGTGAMGQVYLGRAADAEPADAGPAAVKIIRSDLADNATFRRRFRRELRMLGTAESPFTASLAGGDADAERPWLATRYVPAVSLEEAVTACGPLPPAAAGQLAAAVGRALAAIHAAGVIHRDLKPSNVLLTADGVQVIDFGVARAADGTSLTATGAHVGSAAYMAPEQATGGPTGPPADVFALGSLLAYALTSAPPFGEGRTETVLYRVVHQPPNLAAVDALTSEDNSLDNLRDLIRACLSKDPAERPLPVGITDRYPAAASPPGPGWLPALVAELVSRRTSEADAALASLPPAADTTDRHPWLRWTGAPDRGVKLGLAPLILAGAILITYAILSNTAATQTLTLPPATHHTQAVQQPSIAAPTPSPQPAGTPAASAPAQAATPLLLGTPDFNGYCQVTGQGPVQLIAANYAYGWHCSNGNSTGDNANAVCAWTYRLPQSQVTSNVKNFYDPNTWQCWRIARQLQPPDFNGYCQATGHGPVQLIAANYAYGWHCADGSPIDADAACEWTNSSTPLVSRFQDFYDPSSWQCWG